MEARGLAPVLFVLIFFPVFGLSQAITKLDNNTDQLALLSFKSHIKLDPFGVLQSWNLSSSFCNWQGVTCNVTKQRVTGLNLENFGLVGAIDRHISNLSFLSNLNLQNNSFHGSLPEDIGKLFRLRTLSLGSNHLQGTIPASISLCSKLVLIDLSRNKLEGTIPPELGSLSQLQAITLMDNFLSGEIPTSFGNLSSLTNLILLSNSLRGPIPQGLGRLPFLINLDIGLNHIDGEIPTSVLNKSSLIVLSLPGNRLSGELPADMFLKLTNLTILYLGANQFSGTVPASLGNASQLVRVDLSRNNFTGRIPLLGSLPYIEVLSFDTNKLVSDGRNGMDFLTSLANSTKLRVFSLASNLLTGKLPPSTGNLSRELFQFVIGDNRLEGDFPGEIGNLVGLTMLSVEHNSFTGSIPASIGGLPNLQNLYLHNNSFSGEIPESLGNLTLLSEMSLKGNLLTGKIPSSLGNYQHLQVLDLSANMLSGTIPKEIFSSRSFSKLLDLSWNNLSGSIPREIGDLKMIQGVDVSRNKLTWDIPTSIGDCSNLIYLNLSQNSFQGSIPKSLSNLKGLEYLDLSSNNLSGEIPASLETLRFLKVLDLSRNHLRGQVPRRGIFGNESAVSLTENPQLCSGILEFKLPNCPVVATRRHSSSSKVKLIIGLVVGFAVSLTLCFIILVFIWKGKVKKRAPDDKEDFVSIELHQKFHKHELKAATRNFIAENLIGEGSFGTVYKGVFSDGTVAAIKVFKLGQHKASKSFLAECEALRNIRHRSLVKTISVCSSEDFKALVIQFMPNGSLENWLHQRNGLGMKQRLEIAQAVASAIEYLHHDCETPVVHCDLKPSNVLLDEDMCAHVADFGLARILILDDPNKLAVSSSLGLKGSIGYISPEYGIGGAASTKGDVYSFGILMLELFTRKKPTDEMFSGEMDLQRWVSMALPHGVTDILDQRLVEEEWDSDSSLDCLITMLEIGLMCAANSPEVRPSMREVSTMIKGAKAKLLS